MIVSNIKFELKISKQHLLLSAVLYNTLRSFSKITLKVQSGVTLQASVIKMSITLYKKNINFFNIILI